MNNRWFQKWVREQSQNLPPGLKDGRVSFTAGDTVHGWCLVPWRLGKRVKYFLYPMNSFFSSSKGTRIPSFYVWMTTQNKTAFLAGGCGHVANSGMWGNSGLWLLLWPQERGWGAVPSPFLHPQFGTWNGWRATSHHEDKATSQRWQNRKLFEGSHREWRKLQLWNHNADPHLPTYKLSCKGQVLEKHFNLL